MSPTLGQCKSEQIDWFTTLVRHFANVANPSDQPTYIGPMLVCWLGIDQDVRLLVTLGMDQGVRQSHKVWLLSTQQFDSSTSAMFRFMVSRAIILVFNAPDEGVPLGIWYRRTGSRMLL